MYKVYQIQNGDTIDTVARMFGTSRDMLQKINGMSGDMALLPGSFIIVPDRDTSSFSTYVVKKGDNMYAIAKENQVDYESLLLLNGLDDGDYIYPGDEILIPMAGSKMYFTKEGDTLKSVLSELRMNIDQLQKLNDNIYLMPEQLILYQ